MELLVEIGAVLDDTDDAAGEEAREELCSAIRCEFTSICSDVRVSFGTIAFGLDEPDRIRDTADGWDQKIKAELRELIRDMADQEPWELRDRQVEALSAAARAANDQFNMYGKCGVLRDNGCGWPMFQTTLGPSVRALIHEHPEQWALVSLSAY